MPWSATLISTRPASPSPVGPVPAGPWLLDPRRCTVTTTRVRSGLYATAFSSRLRSAVISWLRTASICRPRSPAQRRSICLASAAVRTESSASATTSSTATVSTCEPTSSPCSRDSSISSLTIDDSRAASCCIRAANRTHRLRVLGGALDRLGQQRQRADRGLQLVRDVGDEVAPYVVDPGHLGPVVGQDERQVGAEPRHLHAPGPPAGRRGAGAARGRTSAPRRRTGPRARRGRCPRRPAGRRGPGPTRAPTALAQRTASPSSTTIEPDRRADRTSATPGGSSPDVVATGSGRAAGGASAARRSLARSAVSTPSGAPTAMPMTQPATAAVVASTGTMVGAPQVSAAPHVAGCSAASPEVHPVCAGRSPLGRVGEAVAA